MPGRRREQQGLFCDWQPCSCHPGAGRYLDRSLTVMKDPKTERPLGKACLGGGAALTEGGRAALGQGGSGSSDLCRG